MRVSTNANRKYCISLKTRVGECMYSGGQIIVGKGSQLVLGANEFYGEYYFVFSKIFLLDVDSECLSILYSGCHILFCIFSRACIKICLSVSPEMESACLYFFVFYQNKY